MQLTLLHKFSMAKLTIPHVMKTFLGILLNTHTCFPI
jgi:hypothetical protein